MLKIFFGTRRMIVVTWIYVCNLFLSLYSDSWGNFNLKTWHVKILICPNSHFLCLALKMCDYSTLIYCSLKTQARFGMSWCFCLRTKRYVSRNRDGNKLISQLEIKDQRSRSNRKDQKMRRSRSRSIGKDHQKWSRSHKRSRSIKWSRSFRSRSMIFLQPWKACNKST